MMISFDQRYIIVLPIQQVLQKKSLVKFFFWSPCIAEGGICAKIKCHEKTMPCIVFKGDKKRLSVFKEPKKHHIERF